jgi:hypothetical protein
LLLAGLRLPATLLLLAWLLLARALVLLAGFLVGIAHSGSPLLNEHLPTLDQGVWLREQRFHRRF